MKSKKTGSRNPKKGRNEKGQWLPGICGNKKGRGAKKEPLPKCLTEQLADAMSEKVAVTDAKGKQRMVSAYEATVRRLAHLSGDANLKDLTVIVRLMQELHVPALMRQRAEEAADDPITPADLELLKRIKKAQKQIAEDAAANAAELEAQEPKPKLKTRPKQPTPRKPRLAL